MSGRLALVALMVALLGGACGRSAAATIALDGSPRRPSDEGVVTAVSATRLTLDGKRTYRVDRKMRAFDSTTLQAVPLLSRQGMYVQVGAAHGKVSWLASYTLVVNVPGQPPTAFHSGAIRTASDRRHVVFADGSVLATDPVAAVPPAGRQARADIDVASHRVRSFSVSD